MELRYDISAVGQQQIRSVLRGIESEILASNRRMTTAIRGDSAVSGGRVRLGSASPTNEVKALARVRISEDEKVARAKERLHQKFVNFEGREIERITRLRLAGFEKERAARTRLAESMSKGIGTSVRSTTRTVATGATLVGGILIGQALHSGMQTESGAARVANQGMRPDLAPAIAKQAYEIRGQTSEASINALDQFTQKSGDIDAAMKALPMLGKLAAATSADFGDLGSAAGTTWRLLGDSIKDPLERMKAVEHIVSTLAVQGNMQNVEVRDLVPHLGMLAATTRKFGGDPEKNLLDVAAIGQLAVSRGGATDAAEEVTAVSRAVDDLIKDATGKKSRKLGGFNPFTDKSKTHLKGLPVLFADAMQETHGDLTRLGGMFGVRGARAISGVSSLYLDAFNSAEKTKKGTGEAAGRAAVIGEVGKLSGAHKDMDVAADTVYKTGASRYIDAMNRFDEAIGEKLVPAVTELIPQFVKLVPAAGYLADKLAWVVDEISKNPIEGIGALVLGKISADIAMAGIGKGLSFLLMGIIKSAIPSANGGLVGPAVQATSSLLGSGVSWAGGALTGVLGAGGALAATGALAAGSVAAAGYNGYQLYKETAGFSDFGGNVGQAKTPEEYDAMMKKAGINSAGPGAGAAAAGDGKQMQAAQMQLDAAKAMTEAAKVLASARGVDPARTKPIVAR